MIYCLKKGLKNHELLRAYLKKYDSKQSIESKRFTVLTDINLSYYYNEKDYIFNPENYIARISLKDISIVKKYITKKKNLKNGDEIDKFNLDIYTSKCMRRNKTKGARVFRFTTFTKDSLISWYSALEVARLNSIYEGCCDNYGKFELPFINENKVQSYFEENEQKGIQYNSSYNVSFNFKLFFLEC